MIKLRCFMMGSAPQFVVVALAPAVRLCGGVHRRSQLPPTREAVLAGNGRLCITQPEPLGSQALGGSARVLRMRGERPLDRRAVAIVDRLPQLARLSPQLVAG